MCVPAHHWPATHTKSAPHMRKDRLSICAASLGCDAYLLFRCIMRQSGQARAFAPMGPMNSYKYSAFLSYSHRDNAWATRIHRALERFQIGDHATSIGPDPSSLRPIFRDREEFSAGKSLAGQTREALEASAFLILLCSPYKRLQPPKPRNIEDVQPLRFCDLKNFPAKSERWI